jgi:FKBP-type peptidyl-prolyl cis-trans isomerase
MNIANRYGWIVAIGVLLGTSLTGCEETSDQIGSEKRIQNDEEIRAYLSTNNITAQRTAEGLYYQVVSKGTTAQKPAVGDELKVTYVARRLDGVLVDSSEISLNKPIRTTYGINRLPFFSDQAMGLVFGTPLLTEGDSAVLLLPSYLSLGSTGTLLFPAYSPVRIDLKVTSVRTEAEQLDDFVKEHALTITETTASGLRFGKQVAYPDSAEIKTGSILQVKYTGRRMDYTIFDSGTISVTVGSTSLVPGFVEGLLKMRAGEKANLLFPSVLGYGTQGSQDNNRVTIISPFSPLYFEVTIVSKTN